MADKNYKTLTKRSLVLKANSTIVVVTSVAAFIVIFLLVASKTLFSQAVYQNRVSSHKLIALVQIESDIKAGNDLASSYATFNKSQLNIIGGSLVGSGPNDGSNARIVLDALPSSYDFPALVTSLEKIIANRGLTINSITGVDDEVAQQTNQSSLTPQPIAIPFQVQVNGSYAAVQALINDFQNSIRPFVVQKETISGSESNITLNLTAQTYYQPAKILNIESKIVK